MAFARLGGLFALVVGMSAGACSGKINRLQEGPGGLADGGAGSAGTGAGGQAGPLGTSGEASSPGTAGHAGSYVAPVEKVSGAGKLAIPPPPDDSCQRFHVTVGDCPNSDCLSTWPCPAAIPAGHESGADWWWCATSTPERCIIGFDCAAAETPVGPHDLINCLGDQNPCSIDADCAPATVDPVVSLRRPYCVIDARYASGNCSGGRAGDTCREDDDCLPGNRCIAIREDGKRACSDGVDAHGSLCNVDSDCDDQRCFHSSTSLVVGLCSSGKPGAPCITDNGICLGDARCIPVISSGLGPDGRVCSSGNVGDPCYQDSDCKSQHCPTGRDSVCTEGALGEPCLDAADCGDGFCGPPPWGDSGPNHCTTGGAGESCAADVDCKSKHCIHGDFSGPYPASCGA